MTTAMEIAAPLAAALSGRGYDTLTSVQLAVLDAEAAGRDLLVSAQTGSGKTVAFGISIARDLLDGAGQLGPAATPLALIVAPTRELALQVRSEFEWLYAGAGAAIASCVGGMDYRTERRALDRGAHIVVGTPGRLRDHITRGGLDLSAVRAVVLDEADEMLDLGFSEDLEFILGSAPAERRVLMFSATVPPEIERLAGSFQHDALRLRTAGEARQHTDIDYQCFNVAQGDREHAIINLLRFHEAERAIVFCKTRAEVTHLLGRFHNRGFQVVALSGELSQSERTHALQAIRDGRARVCVATDVAARGIDLPGLELVIHADLPQNPEALLHRSGRTGRAGRHGISALIVTPRDYKKAQRLLQSAKLKATWAPAPSADAVLERDEARLLASPELAAPVAEEEAGAVAALTAAHDAQALAAAVLRLWRAGRSAPEEITGSGAAPAASAPTERRDPQAFGASTWYALSVGHEGRAEARWILPKLCNQGGITRAEIGAIRVVRDQTYVQIAAAAVPGFEQALGAGLQLEPGLVLARLPGAPDLERAAPQGRPQNRRPPRPEQPAPRPAPPAPRSDAAPDAAPVSAPSAAQQPAPAAARAPSSPAPSEQPPRTADPAGEGAPAKKARWTTKQKAGRDPSAPSTGPARDRAEPEGRPFTQRAKFSVAPKARAGNAEGTPKARAGHAEGSPKARAGYAEGSPKARAGNTEGSPTARHGKTEGTLRARPGNADGAPKARTWKSDGAPKARAGKPDGAPKARFGKPAGKPTGKPDGLKPRHPGKGGEGRPYRPAAGKPSKGGPKDRGR